MKKEFYSNGKLLLTGEYAVLDGALALAVPTRYGQSMSVDENTSTQLRWKSFDKDGTVWFEMTLELSDLYELSKQEHWRKELSKKKGSANADVISTFKQVATSNATAEVLINILAEAINLNPGFLKTKKGYSIETKLDFHRDWGLGSSSTLINNIAQWAGVDAYQLLWKSFSGSGYDIACAQNNTPILYRLLAIDNFLGAPEVTSIDFNPPFTSNLFFVYLNKKQNSRDGIKTYRKADFDKSRLVQQLSQITEQMATCQELTKFKSLIDRHETLISEALDLPTVKESLFPDFEGSIKSLGAWGGDFVMVTGKENVLPYFNNRGYRTVIPYQRMVLTR